MERLTIPDVRVDEHTTIDARAVRKRAMEFYWRLKAYEDTGLTPEEVERVINAYGRGQTLRTENALRLEMVRDISTDRLCELAEADKDGRVVVLPCQSGQHVFALLDGQKRVRECEVKHAVLDGWRKVFFISPVDAPRDVYGAPFGAFGQTVFLTREEAEAALEAKRDG